MTDGVGRILVGVAMLIGSLAPPAAIAADPLPAATASSEWSGECAAAMAADRIAGENNNYWQTVKDTDKGAWWQLDLGTTAPVAGVAIAWAKYEDRIHCPPARAVNREQPSARHLRSPGPRSAGMSGEQRREDYSLHSNLHHPFSVSSSSLTSL